MRKEIRILKMADLRNSFGAVHIQNCSKGYQTTGNWCRGRSEHRVVFDGVNLIVPVKITYALLGPSGCGKTTLLKCIMGRLQVDSGTVKIFGQQLGLGDKLYSCDIGYMPQETALFALLTIEQTFQYYGTILGLENDFVKSQIKFFIEFLKLPPKGTINNKLSGGQLRRLSFAVATIHRPKLLVLDEPTVGVDPIGTQRMWCYLRYLKKNFSTTIILTTHYLEEARSANLVGTPHRLLEKNIWYIKIGKLITREGNTIGLMHNGSMIAQGSPQHLMDTWQVKTLEELFYEICSKQAKKETAPQISNIHRSQLESEFLAEDPTIIEAQLEEQLYESDDYLLKSDDCIPTPVIERTKSSGFINLKRLGSTLKKNIIQIYRFPFAFFAIILLPSSQLGMTMIAMTGTIYGLNVGVFNADQGSYGDMYLQVLDPSFITQVPYVSYLQGQQDVADGKLLCFILIEKNFSVVFAERFVNFQTLKRNMTQGGNLNLTLDTTDLMLANALFFHLATKFSELTQRAVLDANLSAKLSSFHLQFEMQPKELIGTTPLDTGIPYELIIVIFVTQMAISMMLLFLEKASGYLERSLVIGVTVTEIIISYVIIQFVLCLVQVALMLILAFPILKATLVGSIGPIIVVSTLAGLAGMSTGMLASAAFDKLMIIGTLTLTVALAATPLAGMIIPLVAAPDFFHYLCMCLPFYLPGEAMVDLQYRDLGLLHQDVIVGIAILLAWIVVQIVLSIFCLHRYVK